MSKEDFVALLQRKQELRKHLYANMKHVLKMDELIVGASDASQLSPETRATLQAVGVGLYLNVTSGDLTVEEAQSLFKEMEKVLTKSS